MPKHCPASACIRKAGSVCAQTINGLGKKAREGTISIDDMAGGTFTISNGGVYGSLLSTPIINPPQSAILGMHSINQRAMVRLLHYNLHKGHERHCNCLCTCHLIKMWFSQPQCMHPCLDLTSQ